MDPILKDSLQYRMDHVFLIVRQNNIFHSAAMRTAQMTVFRRMSIITDRAVITLDPSDESFFFKYGKIPVHRPQTDPGQAQMHQLKKLLCRGMAVDLLQFRKDRAPLYGVVQSHTKNLQKSRIILNFSIIPENYKA